MTAHELHESDPGFRGFISSWVTEGRCPLPLVDYLLEREMLSQAECARWAATEPVRRWYGGRYWDSADMLYPYPRQSGSWSWGWYARKYDLHDADDVPLAHVRLPPTENWSVKVSGPVCFRSSPATAILALMDAWTTEPDRSGASPPSGTGS